MAMPPGARKRINALVAVLVVSIGPYWAARSPARVGWPGAFIVGDWTPGPLRVIALREVEANPSVADIPLYKKMMRSDDPRLRRRGIALIDRYRSMDQFFEVERLTRDRDPAVRATAYAYLPFPRDHSLPIAALMTGLRDDSDVVVAVSARKLTVFEVHEALPELVAYLRAKRDTGLFTGEDAAVADAAAQLAGLRMDFQSHGHPLMCGTPFMFNEESFVESWRHRARGVSAFLNSLRGYWDDGFAVEPKPFEPVAHYDIADDFAQRDKLLAWWDARGKKAGSSPRKKVRNASQ